MFSKTWIRIQSNGHKQLRTDKKKKIKLRCRGGNCDFNQQSTILRARTPVLQTRAQLNSQIKSRATNYIQLLKNPC